ncbi:MAG: energy transducer TonB [Sphingomonas sp.]|nr:energy transducer TonB [Sphingomonas sp.]
MRLIFLAPMLALGGQAAPPALPVPPIVSTPPASAGTAPTRLLVAPRFGPARCIGGDSPALTLAPRLAVEAGWSGTNAPPVTLSFAIDATGRPHDIERRGQGDYDGRFQAALAVARFAPGVAKGCTISVTRQSYGLSEAPRALAIEALFFGGVREPALIDAVFGGAPSNCRVVPSPRVTHFPEFNRLARTPGTASWTILGYDLDARGRVRGAKVEASSGDAELDRAGLRALGASRFQGPARQGCLFRYSRGAGQPLAAPEKPPRTAFKLPGGCPEDIHARWLAPPRPRFPEAFRARHIEGWAVIGFDVAPWGQPGNARVLNAEPAAVFGEAAKAGIEQARLRVDGDGYRGCVEHVRFRIGEPGEPESARVD